MLHAVVMAGGSGTRFWPVSRRSLPKQFLTLFGEQSLIQQTVSRSRPLVENNAWVVTGAAHAVETGRQLPDIASDHILVEPCGRNTAPCIGLAAIRLLAEDPDAVMLVTPADHVITPTERFLAAVERAADTVEQSPEKLCLFGIVPTRPATGYGYIERGAELPDGDRVFDVARFREKPNLETAQEFLDDGNFLWNSGIFVWRADTIVRELERLQPELFAVLVRLRERIGQPDWDEALEHEFPQMPSISIDYAVLEHSKDVCVMETPFIWDDVGSWAALARLHSQDEHGNTVLGNFSGIATSNCTVHSSDDHLVATIGLENCVIVHTPNATLVAQLDDESQIRDLLKTIEADGYDAHL